MKRLMEWVVEEVKVWGLRANAVQVVVLGVAPAAVKGAVLAGE